MSRVYIHLWTKGGGELLTESAKPLYTQDPTLLDKVHVVTWGAPVDSDVVESLCMERLEESGYSDETKRRIMNEWIDTPCYRITLSIDEKYAREFKHIHESFFDYPDEGARMLDMERLARMKPQERARELALREERREQERARVRESPEESKRARRVATWRDIDREYEGVNICLFEFIHPGHPRFERMNWAVLNMFLPVLFGSEKHWPNLQDWEVIRYGKNRSWAEMLPEPVQQDTAGVRQLEDILNDPGAMLGNKSLFVELEDANLATLAVANFLGCNPVTTILLAAICESVPMAAYRTALGMFNTIRSDNVSFTDAVWRYVDFKAGRVQNGYIPIQPEKRATRRLGPYGVTLDRTRTLRSGEVLWTLGPYSDQSLEAVLGTADIHNTRDGKVIVSILVIGFDDVCALAEVADRFDFSELDSVFFREVLVPGFETPRGDQERVRACWLRLFEHSPPAVTHAEFQRFADFALLESLPMLDMVELSGVRSIYKEAWTWETPGELASYVSEMAERMFKTRTKWPLLRYVKWRDWWERCAGDGPATDRWAVVQGYRIAKWVTRGSFVEDQDVFNAIEVLLMRRYDPGYTLVPRESYRMIE